MKKTTLLNSLFAGFAGVILSVIVLVCAPAPALAQHGGHAGGGGGGGFHGGGGFSSGGYRGGGASAGSYRGGRAGSAYRGGGYGGMRGASAGGSAKGSAARSSGVSRPWSFERGGSVRETSPGFHSFAGGRSSAGLVGGHGTAIAYGRFHSFAGVNGARRGGFYGRGGFGGFPGFGWGGFGWGFGWGWNPYWAWPYWYDPYWYNPWWGDYAAPPDSYYPY